MKPKTGYDVVDGILYAAHRIRTAADARLRELGLSLPAYKLMRALDDSDQSMREVSDILHVSPRTAAACSSRLRRWPTNHTGRRSVASARRTSRRCATSSTGWRLPTRKQLPTSHRAAAKERGSPQSGDQVDRGREDDGAEQVGEQPVPQRRRADIR